MRGRSYSPSPPRGGYGRRGRSPSPRGRYGGRSRDLPTSLLVRNLRHDCREPRGFGFVQFVEPADAEEAKYQMDGQLLQGREVTVVFAEENRKKPSDMRHRERASTRSGRYRDRRRSPPQYSRSPRYSRSPPPRHTRSRSRSRDYYSPPPKRRDYSRSVSPPQERRYSREKSFSRSPPPYKGSRSHNQSPNRGPSRSRSRSRSHSPRRIDRRTRSPINEDYPREPNGDRSPSP
ncbi:serine/arginine-rich SC35-like splicing factor SCL30A [Prunus yedoensis var. nudiflora]|uniref:Serine/arginine-rich SC35-like splicing factor SCL30A n=1 Tax=Prunus yedoensis var. nudiflora TaxID=2094558 RepID=A0A314XN49_PRUYE|nr:serine/arginine-rich SC35-like splicing factor SCL30A [Prunus yedoensis var. nudiflora]